MWGIAECSSRILKKKVAEEFLGYHFLSVRGLMGNRVPGNAYGLSGSENPSAGKTKVKSVMKPPLRLLESGALRPGMIRPLKGAASYDTAD